MNLSLVSESINISTKSLLHQTTLHKKNTQQKYYQP